MNKNFVVYDTETSDRNPFFCQIFQLAAVLTDSNLNPIDSFDIRSKRLPHILPSPGALLVNGLNPNSLDQAQYTNYEFAGEVRQRFLEWSPAITFGYNSFGFDEKCLRSLFYQNLYPPYLTQLGGNSRIDILPLAQAAEILYPSVLIYPINQKGKSSKKLEDIAPANGFNQHNAHDALGDVEATLHIARLIKTRAPILWETALNAKTRSEANERSQRGPLIYIHDNNYGHPITFPAMMIGKVHDGRDLLLADLRFDAPDITAVDSEKLFKGPSRYCRVIKLGEAPLIFLPEEFEAMPHGLVWNSYEINGRMQAWRSIMDEADIPGIYAACQTPFEIALHPEAAIYENFEAFNSDAMAMEAFHNAKPENRGHAAVNLTDQRFQTFAKRIIFDNFSELLTGAERASYRQAIKERLRREDDVPWVTLNKALIEANTLMTTRPDQRSAIERIISFMTDEIEI